MKKIFILLFLIIFFGIIFKIPEYHELNDLAIIQGIGISYENNNYTIYMKEVIPIRNDEGIKCKYKIYIGDGDDLNSALLKVSTKTKKKLYYKRCKFLITNIENSDSIKEILRISPNNIYHPSLQEDIKNILLKTNS